MSLEIKTGYMTAAQLDELEKNKGSLTVPTTNTTTVSSDGPKIDIDTAVSKVGADIKVTTPKPKPIVREFGNDVQSILNANREPTNMTMASEGDSGVNQILDAYRANKTRFLQETINLATMGDADQAAQVQILSKEFGIAPSIVESNLAELKRKSELMKIDFKTLQADSPILAKQLQNITFSSVAHDDLEPLGKIESAFRFVKEGTTNAFTGDKNVPTNFKAGNAGTDYGHLQFEVMSNGGEYSETDLAEVKRLKDLMAEKTSDSWLGDAGYVAGSFYQTLRDAGIVGTGTALTVAGGSYLATLPYQGPLAFTPGPEDVLAGGGASAVGLFAGGKAFFTTMAGAAFRIESGHSYGELRELGATHENASNIAFVVGTTNAALEMIGVKAITAPWRKGWQAFIQKKINNAMTRKGLIGDVLGTYLAGIGVETGTEVLQEITAIMGEEFAKMQDEGIEVESLLASEEGQEELWHRLEEIFKTTARGMAVLALPGASVQYASGSSQVSQANQTTQLFEALSGGAVDSKLVARLPEEAQDFVKEVTKDGNVNTVYIDHEKFQDYLNKRGIDPDSEEAKTFFQDLGIDEQLPELAVTGGDVEIAIEKYTTNIANTDHHPDLAPHIRVNQDHWSASESENWKKNNPDYTANLEAIETEAERIRNLSDNERQTNIVYKEVFDQLVSQGTSREDSNAQAAMYSAVFEVLGKEGNINAAELFQKYGLDIQRVFDGNNKVQPKKEIIDVVEEVLADKIVQKEAAAYETSEKITSKKQIEVGAKLNWDGKNWEVESILKGKDDNATKIGLRKQFGSKGRQSDELWTNMVALKSEGLIGWNKDFIVEENYIPDPEEIIPASRLATLNKKTLQDIVASRDIQVEEKATKAQMIDRISAAQTGAKQAPIAPVKPKVDNVGVVSRFIRNKGGISRTSDLADDLRSQDVDIYNIWSSPATTPAEEAAQAYDNIPVSEFIEATGVIPDEDNGYVSVDWLFQRIVDEDAGVASLSEEEQAAMDSYENELTAFEEELANFEKTTEDVNTELEDAQRADVESMQYDMAEMTDFLENTLNIDLDNSTPEEIEALIQDQLYDPEGKILDQAAFHGTTLQEVFDQFSTDFIGTGEGAQAYGWGLYFASQEAVARHYAETFSTNDFEITFADGTQETITTDNPSYDLISKLNAVTDRSTIGQDARGNAQTADKQLQQINLLLNNEEFLSTGSLDSVNAIIKEKFPSSIGNNNVFRWKRYAYGSNLEMNVSSSVIDDGEFWTQIARGKAKNLTQDNKKQNIINSIVNEKEINEIMVQNYNDDIDNFAKYRDTKIKEVEKKGALYEVDLKPAEEDYLIWDLGLNDQSDKVTKVINDLIKEHNLGQSGGFVNGRDVYKHIGYNTDLTGTKNYEIPKRTSQELLRRGVRGIKFADGNTRQSFYEGGEVDWNYVIFDAADVEITQTFNQGAVEPQGLREGEVMHFHSSPNIFDQFTIDENRLGGTYPTGIYHHGTKRRTKGYGDNTYRIAVELGNVGTYFPYTPKDINQAMEDKYYELLMKATGDRGPSHKNWVKTEARKFRESGWMGGRLSGLEKREVWIAGGYDTIKDGQDYISFHPEAVRILEVNGKQAPPMKEFFQSEQEPSLEEYIDQKQGKNPNPIMLAPNGKPSLLTPEQYREVRSEKFKAWFGDWENDPENASKVLDKNGEPLVVFHGTTKEFAEFDKSKTSNDSHLGRAYYFTTSEFDVEENYAGGGPDLTQRISRTAEEIDQLIGTEIDEFAAKHPEIQAWEIIEAQEKQGDNLQRDNAIFLLAREIHQEGSVRIIDAYLNIRKPFVIDEREFIEQQWNEEYYMELAVDEVDKQDHMSEDFFDEDSYNEAVEEKARDIFYEDYDPEVSGNWDDLRSGLIYEARGTDIDGQAIVDEIDEKFDMFFDGMVSSQDLMNALRDSKEMNRDMELGNEYLRRAIKSAGYDGIDMDAFYESDRRWNMESEPGTRHYLAFDENQPKSATLNTGEFSTINDNIYQQEKRGSIQFRDVGKRSQKTIISLFKSADNSTFLHESGHFFLQVMQDVAESAEASDAIKADWVATLKYLGVNSGAEIGVEQHEKWAESFEQYLFEGKAPTIEMQGPFRKFKAWLQSVYNQATGLGIEINDDIRGVFDRMLGTQDEIRLAQEQSEILALFDSPEVMGFDDKKWQEYLEAVKMANQEQADDLDQKKLREVTRQNSKEYQRQIQAMELEVTKEAEAMPVYKAIHYLQNGEDIETKEALEGLENLKMHTKSLKDTFGPGILSKLPHRKKMHSSTGKHHEDIALVFGFESGLDMITQMQSAQPIKQFIKAQAAERVARDSGALSMNPQKLTEEAVKSIAGSKARGHLLKLQMEMTAKKAKVEGTPVNILHEAARQLIANKKVSNIHLRQARLAENRAYKAAQKAILEENWFEANKQVNTQTLNYYIYREAEAALDKVEKSLTYLDRVFKPKNAKKLDRDSIEAIYALGNKVDLRRTRGTLKQSVAAHIENLKAEGIELPTALQIQALMESKTTHWKDMTFAEFEAFVDSVKSLESVAKYKQKILDQNEKIEFGQLVEELDLTARTENKEHISENTGNWKIQDPDFVPSKVKDYLKGQGAFLASHDKMEFVFEMMDGDKTNGIWWNTFFRRLADAENAETVMNEKFITRLTEIFEANHTVSERRNWSKTVQTRKGKFNKEHIISLALNWGNEQNRDALLEGFGKTKKDWGITTEDIEVMLNQHMEAKDWELVQEVWDLINELWPDIAALQKRITGLVPPKVEAASFETRFGTMRGGYYPLSYSREFNLVRDLAYESTENGKLYDKPSYARAATQQGHVEARTDQKGRLVRMDLGVLSEHMNNVIHDITHREAIFYMNRLMNNEQIKEAIAGVAGNDVLRKIQPWIKRVANPRPPPFDPLEKVLNYANTSATMVAMGFKVTTALVQFFGYSQSVVYLGKAWAWQGLSSFYSNPIEAKKAIFERSAMMRTRTKSLDRDVREAVANITAKDSRLKQVKSKYFYFIGMMDMYVSLPTWTGAYEKAIHEGMSEKDAIAQGDSAVRMTQSSGMIKDLADIQGREDTLYKMFTKFYSYFSAYWNMSRRTARLRRKGKISQIEAMEQFFWLTVLPATFAEALLGRGPNRDDDDDNDNLMGWSTWSFIQAATFRFNGMVGVRDFKNYLMNPQFGMGSPWQDMFEYSGKMPDAMLDIMTGQDNPKDWQALLLGISYLAQLPGRQISNMYEHLVEIFDEGEDFSFYELMVSVNRND